MRLYIAEVGQKARDDALNGPLGKFFTDYWIPLLGSSPRGLAGLKHDPDLPTEALTPEYMLEHLWVVGDPEECAQKIRSLYDDVGGLEHLSSYVTIGWKTGENGFGLWS